MIGNLVSVFTNSFKLMVLANHVINTKEIRPGCGILRYLVSQAGSLVITIPCCVHLSLYEKFLTTYDTKIMKAGFW